MMKSIAALALCVLLAPGTMSASEATTAGPVNVTIDYKGKGTVDGSHRVWVWLFDTPEIGPGAMPIAETSVDKNGAVATFNVGNDRVWIAVAFDEQGVMAGSAPPPTGAPIGIYSATGGAPAAVEPGPKGIVTVTFDDSIRMP